MTDSHAPHLPQYLDTADAVDDFARRIAGAPEIALDTEGANFYRYVDRIYLLQVSTRGETALLDPLPIGAPPALGALLADPRVEKILHDAEGDLRMIEQDFGWRVAHLFDTRIAAQLLGLTSFGLAALLERFCGVKLDKKLQRADWSMRPLPRDMLAYAAEDTAHLIELRDKLYAELEAMKRWHWAEEEFAVLERGPRQREGERAPAFLRMKAARDMTPRQLAILRELVAWRDGVARTADKALFRVAADEVLVGIALKAPTSRAELATLRGVTPFVIGRHGSAILQAVERALGEDEKELPRFPRPTATRDRGLEKTTEQLKKVRDAAAVGLALDPSVLCSRERMEAVARRRPSSREELAEIPILRRWQIEVLGEGFLEVLAKGTPSVSQLDLLDEK